jgi:hypothetical protein
LAFIIIFEKSQEYSPLIIISLSIWESAHLLLLPEYILFRGLILRVSYKKATNYTKRAFHKEYGCFKGNVFSSSFPASRGRSQETDCPPAQS